MADRYWVGGTGTWSTVLTTNWSAASALSFTASCSGTTLTTVGSPALVIGMTVFRASNLSLGTITGGSGNTWTVSVGGTFASQTMKAATIGASVPTTADNVFFDANSSGTSSYTVTHTGALACLNLTVSALTPTFATGTSPTLQIAGSLSLVAMTWNSTGTVSFTSTVAGRTISTGGTTFSTSLSFTGSGSWSLSSPLTITGTLSLLGGTFSTNNQNIQASSFNSSGASNRSISLGSSVITLTAASATAISMATITNLTFNAGTSQFNLSGTTSGISSGGLTFNIVNFTSTSATAITITGANTFSTLSFAGRSTFGINSVTFSANQTIGTLTLGAGTAASYRTFLASSVVGTQRTLTVTSLTAGAAYCDFRDIAIAGSASPIAPTLAGDCKGNSGITFPVAKTVYFRQTGSSNWGSASPGSWSLTNGGAFDDTAFPLAQDTAVFPAATYPAAGSTVTINGGYQLGTVDASARTVNAMTLAMGANNPDIYGDWINTNIVTVSGSQTLTFAGRTTQTINPGTIGSVFPGFVIDSPSGTLTLQGNISCGATTLTTGTLNIQSNTFTVTTFSSSGSSTREIQFGASGLLYCGGTGTSFNATTATNLTTSGSQNVFIGQGSTVSPGSPTEANALNFTISGGTYVISTGSVKNLTFPVGSASSSTGSWTIYGNLSLASTVGWTALGAITFAASSGAKTIDTGGIALDTPVTIGPAAGTTATWTLQNTLSSGTKTLTLQSGTLDTANFAISANAFSSTSGLTRSIVGGTSNWTVAGSWTVSGLNFSYSGTGTISMTSAGSKTFAGGGYSYPTLNNGGAGALTISGSNTFADLTNTVQPTTFTFTSGTTTTFGNFSIAGTAGNLVTVGSTSAAQSILQKPSAWNVGLNSTDGGNNSGLSFSGSAVNYLSISYIRGLVTGPSPGNFLVFF